MHLSFGSEYGYARGSVPKPKTNKRFHACRHVADSQVWAWRKGFFVKRFGQTVFFLKVWPNLRLTLSCSKLLGKDYSQGLLLQQAIGEGPSAGSSFAASYWGRTIRRAFFCSKLLGKDYPQGLLLQQAIGEGPSAGSSFAASSWGKSIRRAVFPSKLLGKSNL